MLTVLSVAYPLAPVGPDAVGGAEQILSALDAALVARGYRSIVVACEGSETEGELVPGIAAPVGVIDDAQREQAQLATRTSTAKVLKREHVDLVHMHGIDFAACLPPPGPPMLATLHLPPDWYPREALAPSRADTWVHCVSASQHAACPPGLRLLPPIPNGVAVETFAGQARRSGGFALVLARICPEKGIHLALEAAHAADMALNVAGTVFRYPSHQDYFARYVGPRLDARRRFIGPVGLARKQDLLAGASCLLVPSLAPETSSLVAMEALASGTPVIAYRAGALPEIVEHGRTGFLVADVAEMSDAMRLAHTIDPQTCRAAARARFSREDMIKAYLDRYRALARRAAA